MSHDHVAGTCNASISPDLCLDLPFLHLILGIKSPFSSSSTVRRKSELVIAPVLYLLPNPRPAPSGKTIIPKHVIWVTFVLPTASIAYIALRPRGWLCASNL